MRSSGGQAHGTDPDAPHEAASGGGDTFGRGVAAGAAIHVRGGAEELPQVDANRSADRQSPPQSQHGAPIVVVQGALLKRRMYLFGVLALVGCGVDLWTKHWMFSQPDLLVGEVRWLWPGHAGFQLSLNEGALFGMGQGLVWFFAACSLAAGIAIPVWLFVYGGAQSLSLMIALGAIMGGVFGNLYDRLGWHGLQWEQFRVERTGDVYAVRDFVLLAWRWGPNPADRVVWPNFNVADALLVCGAIALFAISLRNPPS